MLLEEGTIRADDKVDFANLVSVPIGQILKVFTTPMELPRSIPHEALGFLSSRLEGTDRIGLTELCDLLVVERHTILYVLLQLLS